MYPVMVCSRRDDARKTLSENFAALEFACADGSDLFLVSVELVDVLQCIRKHFHAPVTITSAYRTAAHNKKVGGAARSQHLYGIAADIMVKGVTPGKVAAYADTLLPEKGGIGEYRNFVHIDVRKVKCRWNVR